VTLPSPGIDVLGHALVPQYETLRGGALGKPVDPGARAGLAVLLCRGMWAWARTLGVGAAVARPAPIVLGASCELARLLADMTLTLVRRNP